MAGNDEDAARGDALSYDPERLSMERSATAFTAADRIEYSIPSGEVIAQYEPRVQQPPGCE